MRRRVRNSLRRAPPHLVSSHAANRLIEYGENEIGVGLSDAHRGGEADRLAPESTFAEEQPEFAGVFHGLRALFLAGLLGCAVLHKLDAEHQALAADVTDD